MSRADLRFSVTFVADGIEEELKVMADLKCRLLKLKLLF